MRKQAKWLVRNALVAAGNVGTSDLAPLVEQHTMSDDPVLSETAAWARDRIAERSA